MADKSMSGMPGMGDPNQAVKGTDPTKSQQGMDTPAPPIQVSSPFMQEGMKNMPMATPKRVWTVAGTENWDMLRGFGPAAGMVAMMNGMMVGGGPMRSMKMGKMDMRMAEMPAPTPEEARTAADASAPPVAATSDGATTGAQVTVTAAAPQVGANALDITVMGADGKSVTGLTLTATVAMTTMDMGTTHPPVTETGGGHYTVKVNFGMAGPWRVTLSGTGVNQSTVFQAGGTATQTPAPSQPPAQPQPAPSGGPLNVVASLAPNPPTVGDGNLLTVTVTDAAGKPVTGATVTSTVAMTTMDMGTAHPAFKDIGGGKYQGHVGFGMAGPWRVTVNIAAPGRKPLRKAFVFSAK